MTLWITEVPGKLQLSKCSSTLLANTDHESVHLAAQGKGEHIACKVHRDDFGADFAAGTGERKGSLDSVFVAGTGEREGRFNSLFATVVECWIDSYVGWEGEAVDCVSYLGRETFDEGGERVGERVGGRVGGGVRGRGS